LLKTDQYRTRISAKGRAVVAQHRISSLLDDVAGRKPFDVIKVFEIAVHGIGDVARIIGGIADEPDQLLVGGLRVSELDGVRHGPSGAAHLLDLQQSDVGREIVCEVDDANAKRAVCCDHDLHVPWGSWTLLELSALIQKEKFRLCLRNCGRAAVRCLNDDIASDVRIFRLL